MTDGGLAGRRVVVVGASAGIGRALAARALADGAAVVAVGRRVERLAEVVGGAPGSVAVAGDVRVAADCRRVVEEAAGALGGIDLLAYCAGAAPLRPLEETTAEDWATVIDTHVLGAHHVIQAALGHLAPHAVVAVLSSETVGRPRPGLGAYGASKAALDESLRVWRLEHPRRRFTTVTVGATYPTEFGDAFEPDRLGTALDHWIRLGLMTEEMMDPTEVAAVLLGLFAAALHCPGVGVEQLVVRPASPVLAPAPAV